MAPLSEKRKFTLFFIFCIIIAGVAYYFSWERKFDQALELSGELVEKNEEIYQETIKNSKLIEEYSEAIEKSKRHHNYLISSAFKDNKCDDFLKLITLRGDESLIKWKNLLQADLHMRGKCAKKDFTAAFNIYQNELKKISPYQEGRNTKLSDGYYHYIAHIKFRLAALYDQGQVVTQNQEKTENLLNEAALFLGPYLFQEKHISPHINENSGPPNIWNMPDVTIMENNTFHETGPWTIPAPITQKISWLTDIDRKGGKEIFDIGYHLLKGTGDYQKNPALAYEWIYISSAVYDYAPAHYMRAMLLRSQEYYALRKEFVLYSLDHKIFSDDFHAKLEANNLLLKAAKAGDVRADKEILNLYKKALEIDPSNNSENNEVYFWMMRIFQKDKSAFSENELVLARAKLIKYDQNAIEKRLRLNQLPAVVPILLEIPRYSIPLNRL